MTLTTKFKKDIRTLQDAVDRKIFLDVKNPKLYKKIQRYYQNEGELVGEDPDADYNLLIECLRQDLVEV